MSNDLTVIAADAREMALAQKELVGWAGLKVAESKGELAEIHDNLTVAQKNGWRTAGLKVAVARAKQRHEFYRKAEAALRLGYVIVPNLPMDVFAIRTTRVNPDRKESDWRHNDRAQASNAPALGEGRVVSAFPEQDNYGYEEKASDGRMLKKTTYFADKFRDVMFPVQFVKPRVLEATGHALAQMIFDEVGIAPEGTIRRKLDPMIVGQIVYRPTNHRISFLVAWWMSSRDLEIRS